MQIDLPGDVEQLLRDAVAAGRYADANAAVTEGLRLLLGERSKADASSAIAAALPHGWADLLDLSAADLEAGRLVPAHDVLARMDAVIASYAKRSEDGPTG